MKRTISKTILLLFVLMTYHGHAQNTSPTWTAIYQGTGDNSDRFNKIIPDGSGNFIGVGYTVRPGNYRDFLTIKFNSSGDTLWKRTKNGSGNADDELVAAGVDIAGNVYVTGFSEEEFSTDFRTIKYDANGALLWDTLYNSVDSLDDVPVDLRIDANGNCIIGGNVEPDTVTGSSDYMTLKYDPNGTLLWAQQYSNPAALHGKDELRGIDLGLDDNVYVTGRSFNNTDDDFVTIKYDNNSGGLVWIRSYDGGNNDRSNAIVVDNAGNIIVTGQYHNGDNYDYRTNKYDTSGSFMWTKIYNAPLDQDDIPTEIAVDASDNIIVTGQSDVDVSPLYSNYDFQTIKYSSLGTPLWVVRTGNVTQQDDDPNSIAIDASGNIFITGKSDQNNAPLTSDDDFMTVMYNANGNLQWSGDPLYFSGTETGEDDVASCVIVDGGHIYVAGGAFNTVTHRDATVIKYDIATGTAVWVKHYNGEGDFNESARVIVVDANNNSYAAGYSFNEADNLDAIITKVDPAGNVICNYQYKGFKGDDDEFYAIEISSNGFIYAAGYTKVIDQKRDMLLVKVDPATCDTVWTRTYNYINQSDRAESMVLDAVGNIYITGRSDGNPIDSAENNDIVTIKYDSNGNQIWLQRFNGTGNLKDEPVKIILDNAGNVIVAGRTENIHDDDFVILKYNPAPPGAPVWASPVTFGGPFANDDRATDVAVDAADNIFITGYSQTSSGNASQDPIVIKYDSGGNFLHAFPSVGDDKDEASKVVVDFNNDVYVFYKHDADGGIPLASNYDFLLRKFNNNLDAIIFEKQYDSAINGDDVPANMIISPSGDVYITGSSENDTSGGRVNKNWLTLAYDDSGPQIFISNYDGPNATDDSPNALVIRGYGFWVCGNTEGVNNNQKDLTVNYYNLTNVSISDISGASVATVFPNPFHSETRLRIANDNLKTPLRLEIFDVLGNAVMNPVIFNGNSIIIQKGNLASGIYQYRVSSNSSVIANGKLVIN